MGFDSNHDFITPTILLENFLCPWTWGISSRQKKKIKEEVARIHRTVQKDLHDPDNHNGVITHLEPDIMECQSSGPLEASLQTTLVEVTEFQLSCFTS